MAFCKGCKHLSFLKMECENEVYVGYLKESGEFWANDHGLSNWVTYINPHGRCPAWERPWWAFWRTPLEPVPENSALHEAEQIIRKAP